MNAPSLPLDQSFSYRVPLQGRFTPAPPSQGLVPFSAVCCSQLLSQDSTFSVHHIRFAQELLSHADVETTQICYKGDVPATLTAFWDLNEKQGMLITKERAKNVQ